MVETKETRYSTMRKPHVVSREGGWSIVLRAEGRKDVEGGWGKGHPNSRPLLVRLISEAWILQSAVGLLT